MQNTRVGARVHKIDGQEYLTVGSRNGNTTVKKHYMVDYPKDLD